MPFKQDKKSGQTSSNFVGLVKNKKFHQNKSGRTHLQSNWTLTRLQQTQTELASPTDTIRLYQTPPDVHRGPPDSQRFYWTYFKSIRLLTLFPGLPRYKMEKAVRVQSESDRTCKKLSESLKTCQTSMIKSKSKYILSYKGSIGV